MAEYIEREAARTLIKNYGKGAISDGMKTLDPVDDIISLAKGVDLIPVADVAPVRHGRWLKSGKEVCGDHQYFCSECNEEYWEGLSWPDRAHYCPNCGSYNGGDKA